LAEWPPRKAYFFVTISPNLLDNREAPGATNDAQAQVGLSLSSGGTMQRIKCSEVVYREDLYPRFRPNQATIQKYSESIEFLPPIKLNQANILIDGFHRWKAHQLAEIADISFECIETESEKQLKSLAYRLNCNHGLQLSQEEKKKFAQEMFGQMSTEEMCSVLSVSQRIVYSWTESQAEAAKTERDRVICDLYLRAFHTLESAAKSVGVTHPTALKVVENVKNCNIAEFYKNFTPLLYNIWNSKKQDNERKHFGAFPELFMENLLHYHTEPLDIVFDPFGGGGTTVDVCRRMFRRYYVSDRKVIFGRESDIIEHDIKSGFPENMQKPNFVFLDPPYWAQAEGKYSDSADDLGNMGLQQFNDSMRAILSECHKRKVERIAIVIQPTQYKSEWKWTDHIFDFACMIGKYDIEARYILPYSTEQYTPQIVTKAKEEKKCLCLHRDLVVWKLR
jgi:hypothetical protein